MSYGTLNNTYEENVYRMLKRRGLAEQFEHAGIYKISIDDQIVYIGKSKNMLRRLAQHYVGIQTGSERKYRILAEAKRHKHNVNFDVLYDAVELTPRLIEEEIGEKEGEYIRAYLPVLNTQIPKADNWRKYDINKIASTITLAEILANANNPVTADFKDKKGETQ